MVILNKRRENASDQIMIRSSFESDWLRRWRELSGPITRRGWAKPNQSLINFNTPLKNTLLHVQSNSKHCLCIKTRYSNIFAQSESRGWAGFTLWDLLAFRKTQSSTHVMLFLQTNFGLSYFSDVVPVVSNTFRLPWLDLSEHHCHNW